VVLIANLEKNVESLIGDAERFHHEALEELDRGVKEQNLILMRDACEKGWNAVVQAVNALFLKRNVPLPRSHWERRKRLEELEKADVLVEKLGLLDRFSARDHHLHEQGFYEGIIDYDTLKTEFGKVKRFIEDIKSL